MSIVPRDGFASIRILLVTEETVLCSTSASGSEQERLIALDARTGSVRWRAATGLGNQAALCPPDAFYLVTKNHLEKRWLGNGGVYWSNRLDTVPAQQTKPRVTFRQRAEQGLQKMGLMPKPPVTTFIRPFGGGAPSWFVYHDPVSVGHGVLVHRAGMSGGGCVVSTCFEDWLLFDARTGKFLQGGSGAYLGQAGATVLIGDKAGLFCIAKGRATEVSCGINAANVFWPSFYRGGSRPLSLGSLLAFEVDLISAPDEMGIFDSRNMTVRTMPLPATRSEYQANWVLLDGRLLRFPERCQVDEAGVGAGGAWFELYDLNGRCVKGRDATNVASGSSWWLAYAGRTTNGVVFREGRRAFHLEVPSLRIERLALDAQPMLMKEAANDASARLAPTGQVRYVATGDINVSRMQSASAPHDLLVTARDMATGRVLWKHSERVTMLRER